MSWTRIIDPRRLSWLRLGAFAITDQALISGSNFVLSVLLARWLAPADFGMYAICFAIYLLVLSFYQAVILEPMCVFGPAEYKDEMPRYLAALVRLHALLSAVMAGVLLAAALVAHVVASSGGLGGALLGLAVACPLMFLFWLVRTAAYVCLDAHAAARAALLYVVVLFGGLAAFRLLIPVSTGLAFVLMGAGSAVVAARLLRQLRPDWHAARLPVLRVWSEHWHFGRWELSKVIFDWIGENVSYAVVGSVLGLTQAAMLKALTTLFLPLSHSLTALRRIVLPYLARVSNRTGGSAVRGPVRSVLLLYTGNAAVYGLILSLVASPLSHLLYAGKYQGLVTLVPWYALSSVVSMVIIALDMGLRAVRSPKAMFTSSVAGGVTSLIVSWPLAATLGVLGVILSSILAGGAVLISMAYALRKRLDCPTPAAMAISAD